MVVSVGQRKNSLVFIHCEARTGNVTVRFCRELAEANQLSERHDGKYRYVISSLDELVAAQLPPLILAKVYQNVGGKGKLKPNSHFKERKVWNAMTDQEKETQKAEALGKKQEADLQKKQRDEAKVTAAKAKEDAKALKLKEAADKKTAREKEAADKKAAAEAAKAPKAAKPVVEKKPRPGAVNPRETITLLVESNPKREGSEAHKRFALYKNGITVADFLKAGGAMADINWDLGHRLIALTAPVAAPAEAPAEATA